MSITDELREVARTHTTPELYTVVEADTLFDIANRIDEEHKRALTEQLDMFTVGMKPMTDENMAEGGWVRLPVDADGKVIRFGDVLDSSMTFITASRMVVDENGRWLLQDTNGTFWYDPANLHHVKPTVEDVLREFQDEVHGCCDTEDTIAEYADRIREAMEHE